MRSAIIASSRARTTPFVYDMDFQANVLDTATSEGITMPPESVLKKLNTIFINLKNEGVYADADRLGWHAMGATGYEEFSLIDWKTGTLHTPHNTVVFTAYGYEGDGVSAYVDPNFNPSVNGSNYTLNDAGKAVLQYKVATGTTTVIQGNPTNGNDTFFSANNAASRINSTSNLSSSVNSEGIGFKTINRYNTTNVSVFVRGTEYARTQAVSAALQNVSFTMLRRNTGYGDAGISFMYFGKSISSARDAAIRTILNNGLTSLGLTPIANG